jgi:metal-dependent amidase/aminoacylase/carboxypeptidase family protein
MVKEVGVMHACGHDTPYRYANGAEVLASIKKRP